MRILISLIMALVVASPVWSAQEWLKTRPALSGDEWTSWPADSQANNAALDRVLANYRQGMSLSYSSATTVSVSAGEVVCSTAAGDVRKMRQNPSSTNVTFASLDTGSESPSTTYYLYSVADADETTATFKISASSTAPTGITSFKRLGSFYNDASSNIQGVYNDNDLFSSFGTNQTKSSNVTYQATTDGVAYGFILNASSSADGICYADSSSTPTTEVCKIGVGGSAFGTNVGSFSFPVKRGNYWKVVPSSGTATINFMPIGN